MRFFLFFLFFCSFSVFSQNNSSSENYLPNTLILKVKAEYRNYCSDDGISHPGIQEVLSQIQSNYCKKEFPRHNPPLRAYNSFGVKQADLSLIYRVKFSHSETVRVLAKKLLATGFFEYVEPFFLHDELFTPDDPNIASQWHLTTIKALEAWDTAQGDPSIVVGITDTGVQLDHPDLINSIAYNLADPIDGVDNDGDGYIDNYYGWDTGSNDNDPTVGTSNHGITVSGLSSATTNNTNQIAGTGFKSKFLPIRVSDASGSLTGTYAGIVYAVDHGCKIINCSWGSKNAWSQMAQDVITYAAINNNCLVVCAAGNDHAYDKYYPASYDWALSVGGTDSADEKFYVNPALGSNYNELVDIMAPGRNIYTITAGGATVSGRVGTSMASPIVAGAAATVWSKYPTYTGLQIGEILKATADSIETLPGNLAYKGMLGEGRLNMQRSVTETGFPGLYMYNITFTGNNLNKMMPGDTVSIKGDIYNFLTTSSAGTKIKISTASPYVTIVNSEITVGSIASLNGTNLNSNPFKVVVKSGMPAGSSIDFLFTITDGTYNTKYFASQTMNIDYVDVNINKVATSVGASGKMGYNVLQAQTTGLGVKYNGSSSMLYQYGLVVADNSSKVSFVLDGDFDTEKDLIYKNPGSLSDLDVYTQYHDTGATKLDISVKQKTLAWSDTQYENFILLEHTIVNNSASTYSNIHVGMYADWDINPYATNVATYDATNQLAYTYSTTSSYGGIHLLNSDPVHHYAFNNDGSNGSFNIYDGFSETEQFSSLSTGNSRASSDVTDASQTIGAGPYTIAPGDSVKVVFALVAGNSLATIQTAALESDSVYDMLTSFDLSLISSTDPTCYGDCNGSIQVQASNGFSPFSYQWNDALAQTTPTASNLCAGSYTCTVTDSLGNIEVISVTLNNPAKLSLNLGADTTLCGGVSKILNAGTASSYIWSTGAITPSIVVSAAGSYSVDITNVIGCHGYDTIEIYTNTSPSVDLGADVSSCSGSSITLDAGNPGLNFLWSTGASTQTISAIASGTYWVKVTNFGGCSDWDTVIVSTNSAPSVDLGSDQGGCQGYTITLNAGNPGMSYLWSTGSTGQSINASINGTYWVKVTNAGGCVGADTMNLTIEIPASVDLGPDTTICTGSTLVLDAKNVGYSYVWNNGSTSQTLNATKAGSFYVTVGTYCLVSDTIVLTSKSSPIVSYKSDFITKYNTNKGDVLLDFGLPKGGTYSGTAVTGNVFNTITAGDGLHRVDYYYTGSNGCVGNVWLNLDVDLANSVIALENSQFAVFPNPFADEIFVQYSNENLSMENVNFTLVDAQGKLIEEGIIYSVEKQIKYSIVTQNIVPGIYHLILQGNTFKNNYQLVKF